MRFLVAPTAVLFIASAGAQAESKRQLDAHEHGVGKLDIAIDGNDVGMAFEAPAADIVGFEYEAKTAEDREAVAAGVAMLAKPAALFTFPAQAECVVTKASASLEDEQDDHDDHGHVDHDDHADEDGHGDHEDHAAEEAEAEHSEFAAEYTFSCAHPEAIDQIDFGYFAAFPNALELEVQILTAAGAKKFEVERDAPVLDLRGLF